MHSKIHTPKKDLAHKLAPDTSAKRAPNHPRKKNAHNKKLVPHARADNNTHNKNGPRQEIGAPCTSTLKLAHAPVIGSHTSLIPRLTLSPHPLPLRPPLPSPLRLWHPLPRPCLVLRIGGFFLVGKKNACGKAKKRRWWEEWVWSVGWCKHVHTHTHTRTHTHHHTYMICEPANTNTLSFHTQNAHVNTHTYKYKISKGWNLREWEKTIFWRSVRECARPALYT